MTREIKFRMWNIETNQFEDCSDITLASFGAVFAGLDILRFMQYTGLKDKNGVEIYEGDIMKHPNFTELIICTFKNGCFGTGDMSFDEHESEHSDPMNQWEIIGNLYEHPNLLK